MEWMYDCDLFSRVLSLSPALPYHTLPYSVLLRLRDNMNDFAILQVARCPLALTISPVTSRVPILSYPIRIACRAERTAYRIVPYLRIEYLDIQTLLPGSIT